MPKEYGGYGLMDPRYGAIVNEETVRAGVDGFLAILGTDMVLPYLLNYGSGAQKAEWLPRVARCERRPQVCRAAPNSPLTTLPGHLGSYRGDVILGVAMSEPHTGSDVSNVHTRAVLSADGYHLHGTKFWISNGAWGEGGGTAYMRLHGPHSLHATSLRSQARLLTSSSSSRAPEAATRHATKRCPCSSCPLPLGASVAPVCCTSSPCTPETCVRFSSTTWLCRPLRCWERRGAPSHA